jgi:hypothetical protein
VVRNDSTPVRPFIKSRRSIFLRTVSWLREVLAEPSEGRVIDLRGAEGGHRPAPIADEDLEILSREVTAAQHGPDAGLVTVRADLGVDLGAALPARARLRAGSAARTALPMAPAMTTNAVARLADLKSGAFTRSIPSRNPAGR